MGGSERTRCATTRNDASTVRPKRFEGSPAMPHETEPTVKRVRLTSFTTDDIDRRPVYASDRPGSPVATILAMKDEEATRDTAIRRVIGQPGGGAGSDDC
jgi:hypothetical protein